MKFEWKEGLIWLSVGLVYEKQLYQVDVVF